MRPLSRASHGPERFTDNGPMQEPNAEGALDAPAESWVGQDLDWDTDERIAVDVRVQLPFWLFTSNCRLSVDVDGHTFEVSIRDDYVEIHLGEFSDSRVTCAYLGPTGLSADSEIRKLIDDEAETAIATRKCKTVLKIASSINADVLRAYDEGHLRRRRDADYYLQAFCEGHLPIVRRVIQQYRLATYDFYPFDVSPWDVPVWFVTDSNDGRPVVLYPERSWDGRPVDVTLGVDHPIDHSLIEPGDLDSALKLEATPGEFELLDAQNLMQRGDYSGAVRRSATAIEVVVAAALKSELLKTRPESEAARYLAQTTMDFPKRVRQYESMASRPFPPTLLRELRRTRKLRNQIVHGGLRIDFAGQGEAQRSVDTGRWIFNWFENRPDRAKLRESGLAKRSIGRPFSLFEPRITENGVEVARPIL
jgi:hypothetical protein